MMAVTQGETETRTKTGELPIGTLRDGRLERLNGKAVGYGLHRGRYLCTMTLTDNSIGCVRFTLYMCGGAGMLSRV